MSSRGESDAESRGTRPTGAPPPDGGGAPGGEGEERAASTPRGEGPVPTGPALRESEQRVQLALEAGRMGMWEWSVPDGTVRWSGALESIHGLEAGTFPGTFEAFQQDIHPEDRDRVLRSLEDSLSSGGSRYEIEYRIVRPEGEVRHLAARARILRDKDGRALRMIGVCTDLTERVRGEARSRFLARVSPALVGARDPQVALRKVAEVAVPDLADWCVVYLREGDAIRCVAVAHPDPEHRRVVEDLLARHPPELDAEVGAGAVIRTGEPLFVPRFHEEFKERAIRDDEDRRVLEAIDLRSVIVVPLEASGRTFGSITLADSASGRPLKEKDLELARDFAARASLAVENARLLSETEMSARRLEAERTRLARLFDRVPAFIAVVRGPDLEVELANPRFRAMAGGRELVGRPLEEAIPELVGQGHLDLVKRVFRTGSPFGVQAARIEVRPTDGPPGEIFVSYVCEPLREDDGTISGAFVHGVDVTALVRARERAEAAVRSRDEMLAFVSHDLRQPIGLLGTVIHALMELDLPDAERSAMLERALRASEQADRLIDDLMDLARSDLDRLELRLSPVSLPALAEAVVDALRVEADRQGVALKSRPSRELPPVRADADRIHRVLANLLGNALRHTPRGGTVTVAIRSEGDAVACSVADTGPGVPEEVRDRVFERYWRGDDSGGAGLGLGLSIARDIVEAHGGRIWLEDAADGGSVFTFRLPLDADSPDAGRGGHGAARRGPADRARRSRDRGTTRHFAPEPGPSHRTR